jgi:3',5'-nucleoside bisphosphate phosphatase
MSPKIDLHSHTYYSDGAHSPRELVMRAHEAGIGVLSVTDHDAIGGLSEAQAAAAEFGMEVIPGVELSSTLGRKDVHILGYMFDPDNIRLREALEFFQRERFIRAERIVRKLNSLDLPLDFDMVLEHAGRGAVGRPHIAAAMVDEGLTRTYAQAFEDYIGDGGPAFEPKYKIAPEDAVALIGNAGGIAILAHPGWYINDDELLHLIRAGIDGIEVVHPGHDEARKRHYRGIASEYFLLEGGGSDFHGGKRNDDANLGAYTVCFETIQAMKRRLFIQ